MKVIAKFEGSWNCKLTDADCPGPRLATAGIVMYGLPLVIPVAFASVTRAGRLVSTSCKGPVIACWPVLVIVTVALKVWVTRLKRRPVLVTTTFVTRVGATGVNSRTRKSPESET